jgi:hypothetical protein
VGQQHVRGPVLSMDRYDAMCEIAECELCDESGVRGGMHRCDHVDYAAISRRGMAKVKQALEGR